ncbi:Ser/Thr protein kinase RdoA (MazF antagonist) [Catenulispora sp. GP43]|uniref:phosphotransferase enzyme family protein n=1 Tax=Catenulispora sp. GP43 TaxID=3156263 RepID=UPI0035181714
MSDDDLVFGMGAESVVRRDWPSLTSQEVEAVLGEEVAEVEWRSPRPLSTTARVRTAEGRRLIVKRLPMALRTPEALAEEHGFMDRLRQHGAPVPKAWTAGTGDGFTYEAQEIGDGKDRYQGQFSWQPYLAPDHVGLAGHALAKLHSIAKLYDAPARPWRPLKAGFSLFSAPDPIAAIERVAAERPALGDFLAARDWRADVERLMLPYHERLLPVLDDLEPMWTHGDWHGTNLLWTHDVPTSIFDFGLADRTYAVHDIAVALERFAVDWLAIREGAPGWSEKWPVTWFLRFYQLRRRITPAERQALPLLFPLCHAEYELSEIDYFLSVVPGSSEKNAEIAYRDWFLGHAQWAKSEEGQAFLGLLGGDKPV